MAASPKHITDLTNTVVSNLKDQHDWTSVEIHQPSTPQHHHHHQRPLIRGLPPRRLYVHPDDQITALNHEHQTGERLYQDPVLEWVLAVHPAEKWTLANFAVVFDSIHNSSKEEEEEREGSTSRAKRLVLATVHNDSTVVYYLMHEGMVKPRQN